ncbi:depupylase/deamidase Dop [Bifidobacterium vespertilionis]|uniref:Proteasome accessory factor PafA2 n=1 Tax=Bifidobacterium vespertilionis TaxID=2562524 RepID=A0A5J5DZ67_9BIFI|nr:depupylase/deamidase Dop [Bifidobacterium vespertilionis]KAA8822106.1 proteasome accessory factor PafA2 [Bifidobacterium vespertilionis]KAA8824531.1 proteasome accessory factor PafA2 [Bifidobacterium vespertilionis]
MSVRRIMGTETEYSVSLAAPGHYNPVQLSFDVVDGASTPETRHIRWDYRQEDPVNDMRGHRLERAAARPDMLTDAPQLNITNVIAANGARIYVDHAHPEYSAPETRDPFDAVAWDHAGDRIMQVAAERASVAAGRPIALHRNNVDGKGACWGTHENYLMERSVPFDDVIALMTPHFVSRQIYAGSGRVGLGERSEGVGYQLSQRADYVHAKVGLQTTFDRPIINTRDEPHASSDRYRRLHVIVGDANRMEVPQVLKLGVTSMLLWLLEHADEAGYDLKSLENDLALADPVAAMHAVSHDLTLCAPLTLANGGTTTAWLMQVRLRAAVYEATAVVHGTDTRGEPAWPDRSTASVMAMWGQALADVAAIRHANDDGRLGMKAEASRVEWLAKWQLLERLRRKIGGDWDDARLRAFDLGWAALDPRTSIYAKVEPRTERALDPGAVDHAVAEAPADTRAWLRANLIRRFPDEVAAASWTHVSVRGEMTGSEPGSNLFDFAMGDPARYGEAECADKLRHADSAAGFFASMC